MAGQDLPTSAAASPTGVMKSSCSKPVFVFFSCVCDACMHLYVYRHMCVQVHVCAGAHVCTLV